MLNQEFKDILSCLQRERVEFMIVGAYALAAYGYPRATGDIDIWVNNSQENAQKIMRALSAFGAPISDLDANDFTVSDMVFQIGIEPCRIDILTGIDGVEFDGAWKNREKTTVDGMYLDVISKADLLKNKLTSDRDKDQGDIAWLKSH